MFDGFAVLRSAVKGDETQYRLPVNIHLGGEKRLKTSNISNEKVREVNKAEMAKLAEELAVSKKTSKKEDMPRVTRPRSRTRKKNPLKRTKTK